MIAALHALQGFGCALQRELSINSARQPIRQLPLEHPAGILAGQLAHLVQSSHLRIR
jgi:hypothetical protein